MKKRLSRELTEFAINFVYLFFVLAAFSWYRRLILAVHGIEYLHYGVAAIEALILAKIVMIGGIFHIGRRFENRPLIIPTLYRTVVFCIWVTLLRMVENIVRGLFAGKGLAGAFDTMIHQNIYGMLAEYVMTVSAFVPFFAVKVLGEKMGEGRLLELFFRIRRT